MTSRLYTQDEVDAMLADQQERIDQTQKDASTLARAWMDSNQPTWEEWKAAFDRLYAAEKKGT
jgi:ABC-type proline/glycine betaine transport system substrate-binding protein